MRRQRGPDPHRYRWAPVTPSQRREHRDGYVRACRYGGIGGGDSANASVFDFAVDDGAVAMLSAVATLSSVAAAPGAHERRVGAARAIHHLARAGLLQAECADQGRDWHREAADEQEREERSTAFARAFARGEAKLTREEQEAWDQRGTAPERFGEAETIGEKSAHSVRVRVR